MVFNELAKSVENRTAKVGIVGMGYVGTSLASGTTQAGYKTLGFEINPQRIVEINSLKWKNLFATNDLTKLAQCDVITICVPTPVDEKNRPNLKIIKGALESVAKYLRRGQLIVIESSIAPGTTRNIALSILEKKLKAGVDFFIAHSPERVDPGNKTYDIRNTPKVIGALDKKSLELAAAFYGSFVEKVHPMSSLEAAEMTKVLENTFRLVNISFINEIAAFAKESGINIWEVIDAAATKPFGFMAHYPGPGVGGDCIPVLPYHLLKVAKQKKVKMRVLEASTRVNELQPRKVAQKAIELANGPLKNGHSLKVLLVGVSYKPESADIRQSPAIKIWQLLEESGMSVSYHDPYVPNINGSKSQDISSSNLKDQDLIIITTNHKKIPYNNFVKSKKHVIDTRNVFGDYSQPHIIKL